MATENDHLLADAEWLARQFDALTTALEIVTPSEWAESKRYLPPSVTSLPGYYRFEVAPYLREIIDCLSIDSPIHEVAVMKGAQVGVTVGVLENLIGYLIDCVRTAPVMLVTADGELAKLRLESYITPMLQYSGLQHLIQSADETNTRKTGATEKRIEWLGGGFLLPFGAQSANKLRSISVQVLLRDEIDGWPDTVGKDGDPLELSAKRTAAYESSRKILDLSTPTIADSSKIQRRYELGDQRRYYVCCLKCGLAQTLRWKRTDPETGEVTGIVWEMNGERLVADSVRYRCKACGHDHHNDDKTRLLSPEHGAEWRPTATPASPHHRSYHLNALYSPVGMQTWTACVQSWLEAWDEAHGRPRDLTRLQVFYNTVLGLPYRQRGEQLRFEQASSHRRTGYALGQIPNALATGSTGGPVLLLVCTVDVHKNDLAVAVWGWCSFTRVFLVDYWRFEGDTEQLDDVGTWGRLRELIEQKRYVADDGRIYPIQLTLIDSGYRTEAVYRFAGEYAGGVAPVKGREAAPKDAPIREFAAYQTPHGTQAFHLNTPLYKDRWSSALKHGWSGQNTQPSPCFSAPVDTTDDQLRELTVEIKRERIERVSRRRIGWEWYRPGNAPNELWDLLVYANAALDILAWDLCRRQMGLQGVDYPAFYDFCATQRPFFTEAAAP